MSIVAIKEGAVRLFNSVAASAVANAPTIFVAGGLLSIGAATVMACIATKKLDKAMTETRDDLDILREVRDLVKETEEHKNDPDFEPYRHKDGSPYTKNDARKLTFVTYARMLVRYAKLYGPAVLTFIGGVLAVCYGHGLLQKRFAAASAAVAGLTSTLNEYHKRVSDHIGAEEADILLRGGELRTITEDVIDPETGEVTSPAGSKVVIVGDKNAGPILDDPYTYIFDEVTTAHSKNYSHINGVNLKMLRLARDNAQRLLDSRPGGFVELNEVLTSIGLERDPEAIGLGWVNLPGCEQIIDFGIRDYIKEIGLEDTPAEAHDFVLRFNCDGPIKEIRARAMRAIKRNKAEQFCA